MRCVVDLTGTTYTIRDCAANSGGTTYDTEIGGISHCGLLRNINYNRKDMKGCIMTCNDNGCNTASENCSHLSVILVGFLASLYVS